MSIDANDDIIMEIDSARGGKIKGESKVKGHEGKIDVRSVEFEINNTRANDRTVGKSKATRARQLRDVIITKRVDKSSVMLASSISTNDSLRKVTIVFRKQGLNQKDYMTMTLEDAYVTEWVFAHHGRDEILKLGFSKISIDYQEQDDKGNLSGGVSFSDEWDSDK